MNTAVISLVVSCILASLPINTAVISHSSTPILIELFTSEGCSSCPPADVWLQTLDVSQPIPGAELIVLSEHVDYWDHDGWKDPYSLALSTERQTGYIRAMGRSTPYTPQAVVNGNIELRLGNPQQVDQALLKAASTAQLSVSISAFSVEGTVSPILRAHVDVNAEHRKRSANIFAAVALDHVESQVTHGENGGRRLTHVAVLQQLVKFGKLEKEKPFSENLLVKLRPNSNLQNLRLIVFVQEPDFGSVLGAALQESH